MNISTTNNRFRIIIILAGLAFVGTLLFGYLASSQSASDTSDLKLQNYLDLEYNIILDAVKGRHPSEIDYNSTQNSIFDLLIQKEDSIIFWNNYITSSENIYASTEDYVIMYRDITNQNNVLIGLDLSDSGRAKTQIKELLNIDITDLGNKNQLAKINDIKSHEVLISGTITSSKSYLNQISFLLYLLLIGLLLALIYRMIFINKTLAILIGAILSLLMAISHFVLISPLFQNTPLASLENTNSGLITNIQDFVFSIIIMSFWLNLSKRARFINKISSQAKNILIPFLISSGFITICYQIKGFLFSNPLNNINQSILQYTWEGLFFIAISIGAIGVLFYSSLVLYKNNNSNHSQPSKYIYWLAGLALSYPLAYWLDIEIPIWTLYTFVFSYLLILELYLENKEKNIIYTFWWIIILSGFLASVIFYYRLNNDIIKQGEQIEKLYAFPTVDNDIKAKKIDSILQKSNVFKQLSELPYPSGLVKSDFQAFVLSIIQKEGFELKNNQFSLEATDQQGLTLFNNHFSTSYTLTQSVATSSRLSEYVFFNPFNIAYFLKYQIENPSYNSSPFDLIIKLKLNESDVVAEVDRNYTIFKNENIITNHIVDNIDISLNDIEDIEETKIEKDITYSVYKPSEEVKIVAYSKIGGLIKPISLFSFIVAVSGILLFFISLLNTRLKFLPNELDIQFYNTSSLRTRIQVTIIMLIVFSFLIIGVVTAFYFKNVLEDNNFNTQKEEVKSILNDIRNSIEGVDNNILAASTVQSRIEEMSHVHDENLAFFDIHGKLLKTSFQKPKIARVPYEIIRGFTKPSNKIPKTRIDLDGGNHIMDFIPVYYTSQQNPYGYLGISYKPLTNSTHSIRDFLSTILNVYIFLFLIAGALAIAIGNSITKPLSILSNKLKEFKLGKTNQSLDWNTKDEIGNLINEYNMLTQKLDESVNILAKTERDVAWREMAKQVAHEIKNPLTPMKLSIQYLEKAVKSNPDQATAMIERVSATLIEQINNLNQIANEFSNFATMPKASNEKIVINEIVEAIHDLFRKREDMEIKMTEPIDDLYVFADRNHLVRILNNIVKNAIQAIPTDKQGKIKISLSKVGNMAVVSVKDNGSGIPDHMKEKVFTPNFTTKSSGTGLGLAISVNMIESFNGRIYFETQVNVGTEFFVEIPLMRLQDNFPEQNRVSLD